MTSGPLRILLLAMLVCSCFIVAQVAVAQTIPEQEEQEGVEIMVVPKLGSSFTGELMAVNNEGLIARSSDNGQNVFEWSQVKRIVIEHSGYPLLWTILGGGAGALLGTVVANGNESAPLVMGATGAVLGGGLALMAASDEVIRVDGANATSLRNNKLTLKSRAHYPESDEQTFAILAGDNATRVAAESPRPAKPAVSSNRQPAAPDVDLQIPDKLVDLKDGVAVIIGNRVYTKAGVPPVDYATADARTMKEYLIRMFGYREGNIIYLENASQADFNATFGTKENFRGKLFNYVKEGKSDVFIYYSGHGAPDPESKTGYFVPVDCDPSVVSLNGFPLDTFYGNLAKLKYKSLTVVLDACFSGSTEKGLLLKNISPIFVQFENPVLRLKDAVVFTSAAGTQVSSWYPDVRHSLFTYYFLRGLRGEADGNHDRSISLGEFKDYLDENVTYMARRLSSREQTPQVTGTMHRVFMSVP